MPYSVFPTGTTIYDPEKAYNCYVLHEGRDGRSYLIDMNGNTVHSWPYTGFPVEMIDPEINQGRRGDVFCQKEPEIFSNENLLIVDWDANITPQQKFNRSSATSRSSSGSSCSSSTAPDEP